VKLSSGQVAVVTGGGSGIGLALAEEFAKAGLRLVLADIDDHDLGEGIQRVSAFGAEVEGFRADVSNASDVSRLAEFTLDRFQRVDVICNNAGTVGKNMPLWEFEDVEWEWIFGVDLWGVINGISNFVPHLVAQGTGHVVNTASMAGLMTVPLNGPYNAAKHAVISISETLAADLQQKAPGVGVTVLCPGPTLTRLMTDGPRSRPNHLMPKLDRGVAPQSNPGTFASSTNRMLSAREVAVATIAAIERNQLFLAPHPGSREHVEERFSKILEGLSET
jgi:NAD(P)-dependent dehydrogenase (short-subunit alcohol dehydrogenase family)